MNKHLLSVITIFGAVAFAVTSCSEEIVTKDNTPKLPNNLTVDGVMHEQVVATCSQGTYFSISASSMSGVSQSSIGLTFYGSSAPGPGTYQVVKTPPQAGQVNMQVVPNVQTPSESFQADSGQAITVIISDNSSVATFSNIKVTQIGSATSKFVSGTLGCYSELTPPTTGGTTTGGNNSFTLGTAPATTVTVGCAAAFTTYMITGVNQTTMANISLNFSGTTPPAAGNYTFVTSSSPAAGEVNMQVSNAASSQSYKATSGQATVALAGGKPQVTFTNIPVINLSDSTTSTVSGKVGCP